MGLGWLWALNRRGEAYRLDASSSRLGSLGETASTSWENTQCEVPLRKLAASTTCAWAIGSNSKAYLYLYQSDCPCRLTEEVYEHQRWYPLTGFTSHLLPTDPDVWTDAAGHKALQPELHLMPSSAWEWEDPWTPDCNPRLADKEGWSYAVSYNGPYTNSPFLTSFIRRRRWYRTRRYSAVDRWVKVDIPSTYVLIDIAVGGNEVPGQTTGFICVWVVASNGKVLFRSGVNRVKPEGELWYEVDAPPEVEFNQITCSPSAGLLWAVSWEGRLFRRTGQVNTNYIGTGWEALNAPGDVRFLYIALGDRSVWAITMDGKAWFARLDTADSTASVTSTHWLDMNYSMSYLSVGLGDQVFGVSLADGVILYRSGVTEKELSGYTWQPIVAKVTPKLWDDDVKVEIPTGIVVTMFNCPERTPRQGQNGSHRQNVQDRVSAPSVVIYSGARDGDIITIATDQYHHQTNRLEKAEEAVSLTCREADDVEESAGGHDTEDEQISEMYSSEHQFVHPVVDEASEAWNKEDDTDSSCSSAPSRERVSTERWIVVDAGGCILFSTFLGAEGPPRTWFECNLPASFSSCNRHKNNYQMAEWRRRILMELKQRNLSIWASFNDFPLACDAGTWTRCISAHLWSEYYCRWCELVLHLTQAWHSMQNTSESNSANCGLIIKFVTTKAAKYKGKSGRIALDDILCVRRYFDTKSKKAIMTLYVKKIEGDAGVQWSFPLKFAFRTEEEQKSWAIAVDEAACNQWPCFNPYLDWTFNSVWAVSHTGAAYVSTPGERCLIKDLYWRCIGGHFKSVASGAGIVWAQGHDGRLWAYTNPSLVSSETQDDAVTDEVYENQRWSRWLMKYVPLPRALIGAYYAWSDSTGRVDTPKESFKLPGSEWQWTSDWKIDFSIDCDSEGWQYSKAFSRPFTGVKTLRYSAVRRRKWIMKRRVVTTSGTGVWRLVKPGNGASGRNSTFTCIAVQPIPINDVQKCVLVFAVAVEGDLLCRLGVTSDQPEGTHWSPVSTSAPVCHVSIGCDQTLWVVGRNGFAYCCYAANSEDLLSSGWREVLPPRNGAARLTKITSGNYAVYALDVNNRLYQRTGTAPWCPEGDGWVQLPSSTGTIEHISLSSDNQLWTLLKADSGSLIGRRYDIRGHGILCDMDWWDICNVGGWDYVSSSGYKSSLCTWKQRVPL